MALELDGHLVNRSHGMSRAEEERSQHACRMGANA